MKVIVLCGGESSERGISLLSASNVCEGLDALQIDYVTFDTAREWSELLQMMDAETIVLPIVHGRGGEDGELQAFLEQHTIPFLGSNSESCRKSFNKVTTHRILESKGIKMPDYITVNKNNLEELPHRFSDGFVLKPIDGGSSVDTVIVRNVNDTDKLKQSDLLIQTYTEMLAEELITGTEVTCAVVGDEVLPIILIKPPMNEEFDYTNKYNGKSEEICPVPEMMLSSSMQKEIQTLAHLVHNELGARHLSRTDMMIDEAGKVFVLELNAIPGMTRNSLLPKAAEAAGYSREKLLEKLISLIKEK